MACEDNACNLLECMLLDASADPTQLPLSFLKAITNSFSDDQEIGSGGFAVVYKGLLRNGAVAVKKLFPTLEVHEKKFNQEIDSLMKVRHKNIVRFLGYCADTQGKLCKYEGKNVMAEERQRLLCFEFLPKGSLDKYIDDASRGLQWRTRYQIIRGICDGLYYLHQQKIVHLDLKPANILLDNNMVPKIADFGLSKCFDERQTQATTSNLFGSQGYMAPELYSRAFSFKSDIYSLGVIIIEILTGQKGYPKIQDVLESWSAMFETSVIDIRLQPVRVCAEIGKECIDSDPEKRPVTQRIIMTLDEMERTYGFIETESSTSSPSHAKKGYTELERCTPKVLGETNSEMNCPCTAMSRHSMENVKPINFSYKVLQSITDNFSEMQLLGSGTFGRVYKGVHANGQEIAVKVFRDMATLDDKNFKNEVKTLAKLDHQNIVQLVGYCNESEEHVVEHDGRQVTAEKLYMALCFEYAENGSLGKYISDENQGLQWNIRYKIIKGICEGLKHLHKGVKTPVLHLDLKPSNILLDKEMVPKIADFGFSRIVNDERERQTMDKDIGTCGYLPPEYTRFQLLSPAFDIFSLGIIITKIMVGKERYHDIADMPPRKLVNLVYNNWEKRLQAIVKPRSLEVYCHQVKACIKVASECQTEDRHLRPKIEEIINILNDTEMISIPSAIEEFRGSMTRFTSVQTSEEDGDRFRYAKNRIEKYSYGLLRKITNDFSEDRQLGKGTFGRVYKGVYEDGRVIAVKLLTDMYSGDADKFQNTIEYIPDLQHKNVVQLVGYCHQTERVTYERKGRIVIADEIHRALCLQYMQNGSLQNYISDESHGLNWFTRYKIIKGICDGLKYLHEGLPNPILHLDLKPSNILMDENMVPKIADFSLSRLLGDKYSMKTTIPVRTLGYLPPEFTKFQLVSTKLDIFSLGVTMINIVAGMLGFSLIADMASQDFIELVVGNWRNRLKATSKGRLLEGYCQQVRKCIEIALKCVEEDRHKRPNIGAVIGMLNGTETTILHVHPMELCFPFKPKMYAASLLHLCNTEDDHVAFRLVSKSPKKYHTNLPVHGIVPPRCTCTLALMTSKQPRRPQSDGDKGFVLQSMAVSSHQQLKLLYLDQASAVSEYECMFKEAQESADDEVQELMLKSICAPPPEEGSSKLTRPEIEIVTTLDARKVSSIEVHPTKPWIMTTHEGGNLRIWNYQTMENLNPIEIPDEPVYVAKFIAREGEDWIVAGDANGCIHVCSCDESQDAMSFEAHNGQIISLAVHPTKSNVLSSSTGDNLIKLWQWDQYWEFENGSWECTRTFEGHSDKVSQVVFSNEETCSFASASLDGTVKIWNLGSDVCKTMLDAHPDGLLCVDYIIGADRQHLMTGSKDGTAQIWDLEIKRCREYLQGHENHISVVYSHHEHQKLITGSLDGTVRIWNSITFRLENIIALNLGAVSDVGYIEELQRIVVGCHQGIAMMMVKFS